MVFLWVLLGVAVVLAMLVSTSTVLRTFNETPEYTSQATLMLRPATTYRGESSSAGGGQDSPSSNAASPFNHNASMLDQSFSPQAYAMVLESNTLAQAVSERIQGKDRAAFMAHYKDEFKASGPMTLEEVLLANREVKLFVEAETLQVSYSHPDPMFAAKVANYFANELINYFVKMDIETSMRRVEDMRIRAQHQREKMEEVFETWQGVSEELPTSALVESAKLQYEVQQKLFSEMLRSLQVEMTRVALVEPRMNILDHATLATRPSSPDIQRNLLLGIGIPVLVVLLILIAAIICQVRERWKE